MGATLDAVGDLRQTVPQAAALVGLIALVMYSVQFGVSTVPFVGSIAAGVVIAFGTGAMYAVANEAAERRAASITPVRQLLSTRWLSLLGVFVVLVAAGVVTAIVGVLAAVAVVAVTAALDIGPVGAVLAVGGLFVAYLVFAMVAQFLYPAVAIDGVGAFDAVTTAGRLVVDRPVSVLGFTLLRVAVEYVPFLLGLVGALAVVSDALTAAVTTFEEALPDPEAPGEAPAPAEVPDLGALFFAEASTGSLAAAVVVVGVGLLVGEIIRIALTTAYYRRVTSAPS